MEELPVEPAVATPIDSAPDSHRPAASAGEVVWQDDRYLDLCE